MSSDDAVSGAEPGPDGLAGRPSRARYDRVRTALDRKWRRREPQPERMLRELVDALWDAFEGGAWTWCGVWLVGPDGRALTPGRALPAAAPAVPSSGPLVDALAATSAVRAPGAIAVPVVDKDGRVWAALEVKSSSDFDEMDARWLERLVKTFRSPGPA
ncbi:MAG: hypothetical protein HKL90_14860 [Elusimicrobia bacterium]|nr:hypothetical protein [Elusimicrobiota bacterium]